MAGSSHTYPQGPPVAPSASHASHYSNTTTQQPQAGPSERPPSRRSLSQASIPISALISPHAPSVTRMGRFHMRDPHKPPPVQNTPWTLSLPSLVQEGESRWALRGWVERAGARCMRGCSLLGLFIPFVVGGCAVYTYS
ncbi:hypothetical protein CPB84DRAFT_377429 [Gymnopilus junonius]|uniref:Uncharacterized protein n=1 Tax=Gymnopilus junonius TaxID=109634 RepID=A0A9P5THY6_GYMJU|nr:hypothetical protein CPB84DRAFT_377429 [Gymnopilus junonius]